MSIFFFFVLLLLLLCLLNRAMATENGLSPFYYWKTCPQVEAIVRRELRNAMLTDPRSPASLMRLQFHDCFVDGCDGSVLLDPTPTTPGEKGSLPNVDSLRSFEFVDIIKDAVEKECPGVVSCADIIIIVAREATHLTGGPFWPLLLGRKDSLTASEQHADDIIPSPNSSNGTSLIDLFKRFGLTVLDLVALTGSHTIGFARCTNVVERLYDFRGTGQADPSIEPHFKCYLETICPAGGNESVIVPLDATPYSFDNRFFQDLVNGEGVLNSDEILFTNNITKPYVLWFSFDQYAFFRAFAIGMIKMGNFHLSGQQGEIRKNCRVVNPKRDEGKKKMDPRDEDVKAEGRDDVETSSEEDLDISMMLMGIA
ncbi:peroxidase 17-like [Malania oleifera]|uniref:peroxidase 17-like n=1 Tax=Malania oleifera TaxID=397392 RepID=UPI0025AE31B8|nr:peroxidase 17-like [Malania oleifera]